MSGEDNDDILIIEPITRKGRPKDPDAEARKRKHLELQERRIQLKELTQKLKEAALTNDTLRAEQFERCITALVDIANTLKGLTALLVADAAVRGVNAARPKGKTPT